MRHRSDLRRRATYHPIAATAAAMACAAAAPAAVITVNSLADTLSSNGTVTLRGALQSAASTPGADTIDFEQSLFASGPATLAMAGTEMPVTTSLSIVGPGQNLLAIDAQQLSRVFNVSSSGAQVNLSGMTLKNGLVTSTSNGPLGSGGAIYNTGTLALQNVSLANNRSQTNAIGSDTVHYGGGGIYNYRAALTLDGCTFLSNSTSIHGGGVMSTGGTVAVKDSVFTGNGSGYEGGAIAGNDGATVSLQRSAANTSINMRYNNVSPRPSALTITNSTVGRVEAYGDTTIANSTTGALVSVERTNVTDSTLGVVSTSSYVGAGALTITRSTLAQLTQQFGSATIKDSTLKAAATGVRAITVNQGTTLIENSTITGYDSAGQGTLYFPVGDNATIRNSTIAGNYADRGGGIFVASGTLKMDSTIVGDNTADTAADDISGYVTGEFNLIEDATGAFLLSANNLVGVDPRLAALADNGGATFTLALLDGSPAYDAGSNPALLLYDQRGFARVVGAGPDVGAFEGQVPEPAGVCLSAAAAAVMAMHRRRRTRRDQARV